MGAKPTSCILPMAWNKGVHLLPEAIPKACSHVLSILLHSSQFLMVWHVMALPAFVLQPSLGLSSCLPHPGRTFYIHKCVLEETLCML